MYWIIIVALFLLFIVIMAVKVKKFIRQLKKQDWKPSKKSVKKIFLAVLLSLTLLFIGIYFWIFDEMESPIVFIGAMGVIFNGFDSFMKNI